MGWSSGLALARTWVGVAARKVTQPHGSRLCNPFAQRLALNALTIMRNCSRRFKLGVAVDRLISKTAARWCFKRRRGS